MQGCKGTTVRLNYSEKVFSQMAKLDLAAVQRTKSKGANGPTLELEENEVGEPPAALACDLTVTDR